MNDFFQSFLGLKQPVLPSDFRTEHFSNEELCDLLKYWGGGNTLTDPTAIGLFAERAYTFKDDKEYFADPDIKMMWRDGLGNFLAKCWEMVEKKTKNTSTQTQPTPTENLLTPPTSQTSISPNVCDVCGKLSNSLENIEHPFVKEQFLVCYKCRGHGYMTNLGWNVGE